MIPIRGLVLAGGRSRRMGSPKEMEPYRGIGEALRIFEMLREILGRAVFSVREAQIGAPPFARDLSVIDRIPDSGPLGGIHAAFHQFPGFGWLVVPVDMPYLESADIAALVDSRREGTDAVAYEGNDGAPQPLPAIYESALATRIDRAMASGRFALKGIMDDAAMAVVPPRTASILRSVNTPGDKRRAREVWNART